MMPESLLKPCHTCLHPSTPNGLKGIQLNMAQGLKSSRRLPLQSTTCSAQVSAQREVRGADISVLGLQDSLEPRSARKKPPPPVMPAVLSQSGAVDLVSAFYRNRIIFIGSPINSQVAQRVISQLLALEAIDDTADIKMYINSPGGSPYNILAIYDCMAWIKPDVSTVAFGMVASQSSLLLASGKKGKRFAMPNARIMIHQPQSGSGGSLDDVKRQANEAVATKDKFDKMYSTFTGQTLTIIQRFTDRDRFFSAAEAWEFGLVDGVIETEY